MDWPLHPGAVPRPAAKRHGNAGKLGPKTHVKIREARERQDDGALVPDSRLLSSAVWQPLPGSQPVTLEFRKGCAFPVGRTTPHLFCNASVTQGSYCKDHHAIVYRQPVEKTK